MEAVTLKQSLDDMMSVFQKRMDSFEGKLQKTPPISNTEALAAEFSHFKTFVLGTVKALQQQIECLAKEMDRLQMHSRRKILLLHGLAEESREVVAEVVVKSITTQLKMSNFSMADIGRCHRMGRPGNSTKPRPILCKFRNITVRDKIWSSKSSLKGTGVTLSEFLTKTRHNVFMATRERFGVEKCWTRQGQVFLLGPDGVRHRVSCQRDLDTISPKVTEKPAAKEAAVPLKAKRTLRK